MFTGEDEADMILRVDLVDEVGGVFSLCSCENHDFIQFTKLTQKRMQAWPNVIDRLVGKLFVIILSVVKKGFI